jgi:thymidine kinase
VLPFFLLAQKKMSITLILGEMYSGKTTELMRRIDRAAIAGQQVVVYKYTKDIRYGREFMISSHGDQHRAAIPVTSLADIAIEPGTTIGIDEGQFIDHLVEFSEAAANAGCHVIISALISDFERKSFANIALLIPKCEHLIRLHAICFDCKQEASFTKRIGAEQEQELIGGSDKYKAVCRKCFFLFI